MSLVTLDPDAGQAIKSLLSEGGVRGPVRIEIQSTGCCDSSLELSVDTVRESDLVEEVDGVTFVISPETRELSGEVKISCANDGGRNAFLLTSSKPISEWDGLITCSLRM